LDVFDLVAKIRLDSSEYEDGIGKAKGGMSSLASGVGKGLATVAKVGAAAVSAGVAGVTALTKMGVEGYAQYEQLVGGVETLFGTGGKNIREYADSMGKSVSEVQAEYNKMMIAEQTVMKNASTAFKTAGMSANEYMETVTSFSASLIQSLDGDTVKAASVADMAITDMSDNANKMGTSIDMIQNAYNGFAKGNFTMLDNLKLGYGGTQEEMKRLLKDAEALSGVKYDISSFADVTEAIHVMQEEMGIAGTTSREAATTIEGSIGMMKGAWENLVVGMADSNANMDVLINDFVESTATVASNLIPRIEQTLMGIGALIEKLAPIIGEALPKLIEAVLPSLIAAGISLITALISGILEAAPALYQALLDAIYIALTDIFGMSEKSASNFVGSIDGFIGDLVAFFKAGFQAVEKLFSWLVSQAQKEGTAFNVVWNTIKTIVSTTVSVIQKTIQLFTQILKGDWSSAWETCRNIADTIWSAISTIISNIVTLITGFLSEMVSKGYELIESFASGLEDKFLELASDVADWVNDNIIDPIVDMGTDLYNAGADLLTDFWDGLKSVWDSVKKWWDGLTLSDKEANVNVNKGGGGGKFATGLNYVPYDEFPAILHRGEAVLTAAEARLWRKGGYGANPLPTSGVVINQYIQSVPQTPAELANATEAYFEQARWML